MYDMDKIDFYSKFQRENSEWVTKMFHKQCLETAYEPLLGMFEELGELNDAKNEDELIDAIGDTMVFMADYCSCMNIALQFIEAESSVIHQSNVVLTMNGRHYLHLIKEIGKLSHAHLKTVQKIRTNEDHFIVITNSLMFIVSYLKTILIHSDSILTFEQVIMKVWDNVKHRDWNINKENGKV